MAAILKITGDWQKFRASPGAEGTLKVAEPKRDKLEAFNEALKDAAKRAQGRRGDQEDGQEGRRRTMLRLGRRMSPKADEPKAEEPLK